MPKIRPLRGFLQFHQLVTENTEGRLGGLLGEPRINVLALNLALDAAAP